MSSGIFLFNKDQELIKSIAPDELLENYQDLELGGLITATAKAPYSELAESARYFGVKDVDNFWMYKVRNVTKEDGFIVFDGIHIFFDDLKGKVIRDIRNQGYTPSLVVEKIISGTGWEIGANLATTVASANYYHQSALSAFYDAVKMWGFEFIPEIRFSDGKITEKRINIYDRLSKDYGKWYEYGDKLLTVVAETSTDELYTAFIGRGKGLPNEDGEGNLTDGYSRKLKFDEIEYIDEIDGIEVNKPIGQDYIEIEEATAAYGYPDGSPRIGIVDFDDIEDPTILARETFKYAIENARPKLQMKVSALEGENVELGEMVTIIRSDMNIRYKVRIFKIKRDFLKDAVISYEFGDKIVTSVGERLKNELVEKKKKEQLYNSYIDRLRAEITSSYFNEDGYNYDLQAGNDYNLPAGYYSFDRPIDQSPTKVIYLGAGKILIANSKNPDGSWKWTTAGTGDGLVAETVVGTLGQFAKVNANQILVENPQAMQSTQLGEYIAKNGGNLVFNQTEMPTDAKKGDTWYNPTQQNYKIYDGTAWQDLPYAMQGDIDEALANAVIQNNSYNGVAINTSEGVVVKNSSNQKVLQMGTQSTGSAGFTVYVPVTNRQIVHLGKLDDREPKLPNGTGFQYGLRIDHDNGATIINSGGFRHVTQYGYSNYIKDVYTTEFSKFGQKSTMDWGFSFNEYNIMTNFDSIPSVVKFETELPQRFKGYMSGHDFEVILNIINYATEDEQIDSNIQGIAIPNGFRMGGRGLVMKDGERMILRVVAFIWQHVREYIQLESGAFVANNNFNYLYGVNVEAIVLVSETV